MEIYSYLYMPNDSLAAEASRAPSRARHGVAAQTHHIKGRPYIHPTERNKNKYNNEYKQDFTVIVR